MKTIARSSRRPAAPRSLRRGLLLAGSVALLVAALPEVALLRAAGLIDGRRDAEAARWLAVADRLSPRRGAVHFHAARLARRRHDFAAVHRRLRAAFDAGWPVADLEREQWLAMAETGNVEEMQRHWADLFSDPRTDGPEISRAYVVAALARIRLRDARRVLDAWAADHPDDAGPHFFRGMIHAIQLEWEDAGRAYARCLELDPRHSEARRGLAESFAKRLRFGEALEEWTRLLALDPADTAAAVGRCDCLVQLGEADAAQRELTGLLERRPGDVAVLELAGRLELAAGTPARAVDLLSRAVAERPEDAELRYALGRALRLAGDADAARDHLAYREAAAEPLDRLRRLLVQLPQKPWDADIRAEIGELTTAWKSRAEGRQWFLRALDVDPEHPRARAALAHAEAAAAVLVASRGLDANPDAVELRKIRAAARLIGGDWAGAAADLTAAVQRRPGDAPAWSDLAFAQEQLGMPEAVDSLRRAVLLAPLVAEDRVRLVRLLHDRGDVTAAREALRDLAAVAPGHPDLGGLEAAVDSPRPRTERD